ncbi:YjbH domain-containing protein [Colwellia sp. 20A7]|uniref:YjbH domain-containing protein n=1 Tax=Colwellia sp. 20A7 TaxID=2689569 RepID=UPI0013597C8F|nr:YjbH domain-containing protein [Colwellia sp. 20A7]
MPLFCHADSDDLVDSLFSNQGFTGVLNTPNASVTDYGNFTFSYSDTFFSERGNDGGFVKADDLKFAVGLLPQLEFVGQFSTQTWRCNMYTENDCGNFRDLSASMKWNIPFIPKDMFELAVGGQDIGGAAVHNRFYYITASKSFNLDNWGNARVNLGLGKADNTIGYMDGVFGSIEWQPLDYLQVVSEYDANAVSVGVKFLTPKTSQWLPNNWQAHFTTQLYTSDKDNYKEDPWFSAGITIPIGGTDNNRPASSDYALSLGKRQNESVQHESHKQENQQQETALDSQLVQKNNSDNKTSTKNRSQLAKKPLNNEDDLTPASTPANMMLLSNKLINHGFESVSVGENNGNLVVELENNLYNRNEYDAIEIVTDYIDMITGNTKASLTLTNYGLPVYQLNKRCYSLSADCFWIKADNIEVADNTVWHVQDIESTHFVPRLTLSPALVSNLGTEFGAFDYQLLLSSNLQMSLWDGGVIDIRHFSDNIADSQNFEKGAPFYRWWGLREGIDRRLFHQTFMLPYNTATKFTLGQILYDAKGWQNETRWQSSNQKHRVSFVYSDYKDKYTNKKHNMKLLKYRHRFKAYNWDVEVKGGEYWQGDKGFTLNSKHWFGDANIAIEYRRSKFANSSITEEFIGIGFSIPLNMSKSMKKTYGVQVKGIEQWTYMLETKIGDTDNNITLGYGTEPILYHNLDQAYFNRDRM